MIGQNIKKYRILNGLSLRELANKINVSQTAIAKYENGTLIPDGDRLMAFSSALKCSISDLLSDNENRNININFRKRNSIKGKKLEKLKEIISDKINVYIDVLECGNKEKPDIKKYIVKTEEDAIKAAIDFRKYNGLSKYYPLYELCGIVEDIGINIVFINETDFDKFDGACGIYDNFPIICVLKTSNYFRQRFTIAHELGHLVLDIKNQELDEEKICDTFANEFLLPKSALTYNVGNKRTALSDEEYKLLSKKYRISIKAIIYSLHYNKIFTDSAYKIANIHYSKYLKGIDEKEASKHKEQTTKFEFLVNKLYDQQLITESKYREYMDGIC